MNMTTSVERRRFLKSIAAAGLILPGMSIYQHALADVEGLDLGSAQSFDFADLISRAKSMAASPYEAPVAPTRKLSAGLITTRTASCTTNATIRRFLMGRAPIR